MSDRIASIAIDVAGASEKTAWIVVTLRSQGGFEGLGEASLFGREEAVVTALRARAASLIGIAVTPDDAALGGMPLIEAAAHSALAQAREDLAARRAGVSLAAQLGGVKRKRVPLYANINRRTRERTPEGFARSARDALAAGHVAFKLAPFDFVTPQICRDGTAGRGIAHGLACAAAVRGAVGSHHDVMIDCHWRFDEKTAADLIREAAAIGLVWVECPIAETLDAIPVIRRLRGLANDRGMRLAGCEELVGLDQFRPFIEAGAYDVLMPDVKYCGGPREMLRIAEAMTKAGIAFSPHNPSGPVCHAQSLHLCAASSALDRLETQFDEGPLFDALVSEGFERIVDGDAMIPEGDGAGVTLDPEALTMSRVASWSSDAAEALA